MNQQCGEAYLFTASDMLRARLDALEEAAKVCESLRDQPGVDNGYGHGTHDCAGFIRALLEPGNENMPPPAARPEGAR